MNRTTPSQYRNPEHMPKPENRPSCQMPNGVVKQWNQWVHTGIGSCVIEHWVTKDGAHTSRVCSPIWCSVTNDSETRICPPQWWERAVQETNKS
jgi:hypothetical protein